MSKLELLKYTALYEQYSSKMFSQKLPLQHFSQAKSNQLLHDDILSDINTGAYFDRLEKADKNHLFTQSVRCLQHISPSNLNHIAIIAFDFLHHAIKHDQHAGPLKNLLQFLFIRIVNPVTSILTWSSKTGHTS